VEIRPNQNATPPVFHQVKPIYPEVPTQSTQIQQLFNNLATLDIKGIENNVNRLLGKLETTIGSLDMKEINQGVTNLLVSLDRLVGSPEITNSLVTARQALDEYRLLAAKLNARVDPLADGVTNSLAQVDRTLGQVRGAAENIRTLVSPESAFRNDLDVLLQELARVGQSLSSLLDFLKQHPNALITGRQNQEKK
jgi:paraquat-inducible protein B